MHRVLSALLRQEVRSPLPWIALLLAAAAWPLALLLSPLATTLTGGNARHLSYNVAFMACLVGAVYADRRLGELRWILTRFSGPRRATLALAAIAAGALLPALFTLIPLAATRTPPPLGVLAALALTALHMSALLGLMAEIGFSPSARSVGLLLLALLPPALTPSDAGPLGFLSILLDPLGGGAIGPLNFLMSSAQLGSIFTLTVLTHALRSVLGR